MSINDPRAQLLGGPVSTIDKYFPRPGVAYYTQEQVDALSAEIERLRAGGCARDQRLTQHCAEAVVLQAEIERLRAELAKGQGIGLAELDWSRLGTADRALDPAHQWAFDKLAEIERLRDALELIASTDPIDAALDPQRAVRVAKNALAGAAYTKLPDAAKKVKP